MATVIKVILRYHPPPCRIGFLTLYNTTRETSLGGAFRHEEDQEERPVADRLHSTGLRFMVRLYAVQRPGPGRLSVR
jgi:hypothetical protein